MTTNVYRLTLSALLVATGLCMTGCPDNHARVIDSSKEGIVRADRIDVQDFEAASAKLIQSLYESGAVDRAARKPAVVAFNRIINDTGEYFDTDLISIRVVSQLQRSGKVVLNTTMGPGARDQTAKELGEKERFMNDQAPTNPASKPDFTLTGKIMKNTASAGGIRQATYTFQMFLTDPNQGVTVWIDQQQITKQGDRPSVGL